MSHSFERYHHREEDEEGAKPFDRYHQLFGEVLDIETMRGIRDTEDHLIELGHLCEEDRFPVPDYLAEEWIAASDIDQDAPSAD